MRTWMLSFSDQFTLGMIIKGAWVMERVPETDRLKAALAQIAATYPYLTGKYDSIQNAVVWDENAPGVIPLEEVDVPKHKVSDICGHARLAWSLASSYDIKGFKKGKTPPLTVSLARLSDGVVLYVQAAHALMDAASFYGLVRQWAELCKGGLITPMKLDQSLLPKADAWTKEKTLEKVLENGWIKIGGLKVLKMIWSYIKYAFLKDTYSIEVTQEEVAALRKESGAGTHGALSAIAAKKLYAHLPRHKSFKYITVVDMRDRFPGIDGNFMGNISQAFQIGGDYDLSESIPALAAQISKNTRSFVAPEVIEEAFRLIVCAQGHHLPYFCFDPSDMNSSDPGTVYVNNQLKFRACEIDWGCGLPRYVFPNELSDMVKLWQPVSGGPLQIIYGGPAARIMRR